MGNYASCTLTPIMLRTPKAARVIFPGGEVKQYIEPVKAAELMLECPTFFILDSKSLHIGKRFVALGADQELKRGDVYVMFPMKRRSSIVTAADIAVVLMAVNSSRKRISGGRNMIRVLPDSGNCDQDGSSRVKFEGIEISSRSIVCRSKKPVLETIKEEPEATRSTILCIYR